MKIVLDASALLALLLREPGADSIREVLADAAISAANLAEVVAKLTDLGFDDSRVIGAVSALPLQVHAMDAAQAWRAGLLRRKTRVRGLSLGDRACLALAEALEAPAMTMDRSWAALDLEVEVIVPR